MNLLFYYPIGGGAPSKVSRDIFKKLFINQKQVNIDEISIFSKRKYVSSLKEEFPDINILCWSNLISLSSNYIVHIPVLPTILPNSKFLLYLFCKIRGSKLILQYHGDVRSELKSSYKDIVSLLHILTYIFLPFLLKSADTIITHSYFMNNKLIKYGVSKSIVIPNAIGNEWFRDANYCEPSYSIMDKSMTSIFYHGRLSWEKGIDLLIEAIASEKLNRKYTLYIAGEGPQKKELEKICIEKNIKQYVFFLGSLNVMEIKSYLKSADIAIYPSRFDNFPLAVLEALSVADCPVHFSRNIGICDFIQKESNSLNTFDLSIESIVELLNNFNLLNEYDKKEMIDNQKEFAKQYTWDEVILKYIHVYNMLVHDTTVE
ncbi:glycosyltransferase [Methanolobus tindarius DSM 2278]|uniref:Glycosyltransferase n=1 Tax=Methanolobus tindarius DSM 2278 TaxID=1090322 RepID=W9DZJ1_METTI|nr:glycosyltransferase family 4 protein [Methanolobus tindarius]ETA69097.1 glycosyltransferase [Methanolobus tindarius DSM 2278]